MPDTTKARTSGAEFVIAPELFLCGYPPRDLLLRADFVGANLAALAETAQSIGPIPLCVGYVDEIPIVPDAPCAFPLRSCKTAKSPGAHIKACSRLTTFLTKTVILNRPERRPFEFKGRKLGITISEDIWNDEDFWPERRYRRDPVKELIGQGAEIILGLAGSPWHDGKEKARLPCSNASRATSACRWRRSIGRRE